MKRLMILVTAGAAITLTGNAALARLFPIPSPSEFADTESSSCASMAAPDDLSRRFTLTLETVPCPTACVQVAFGVDRNADEDLEPEETDLVVGMDCGQWFMRDEKAGLEQFEDEIATTNKFRHIFSFYQPKAQADRWNLAKVTTRGSVSGEPTMMAESKDGLVISVR